MTLLIGHIVTDQQNCYVCQVWSGSFYSMKTTKILSYPCRKRMKKTAQTGWTSVLSKSSQEVHKVWWYCHHVAYIIWAVSQTNWFLYMRKKAQISCTVTAQLISALVFATYIQSLYFLNPKFKASSHLLMLYSPVCAWSETPKTGFLASRLILYTHGLQKPTPTLILAIFSMKTA